MSLNWLQNVFVTGIVTFLHQVKEEMIAGTLTKQSVKTDAVNSAVVSVFTAVDSIDPVGASTAPQPVSASAASSVPTSTPSTPIKTPFNAYSGGDSTLQL